ncbi:MAG: DNA polymerase IV, partial [Anaerolineales bacterium]
RGKTVQIKIRWSDFTTITRQSTLNQSTNQYKVIQQEAATLLSQVWQEGRLIRLVGVGVHNLDSKVQQLGLWDTRMVKDIQLQKALQDLKKKYGENVISKGIKK